MIFHWICSILNAKKILLLTIEEFESHKNSTVHYVYESNFKKEDENHRKVSYFCIFKAKQRGATNCICNLGYALPREKLIIFQNEKQ